MNILQLAGWIIAVIDIIFVIRYQLHMFQLNGYKNNEHFHWLNKNKDRQRILTVLLITGVVMVFFKAALLAVLFVALEAVVLFYYAALRRKPEKKKLVYTARVKRLIITETILNAVLLFSSLYFLQRKGTESLFYLLLATTIFIEPYMMIFVNGINHPIEAAVSRHFINDAKNRLAQMPDLKIIGVTGSYGKTSVKYYLSTLLAEKYNVLITPESFNTPMGVVRTIREKMRPSDEIFICEMGARHVGDIRELTDIVHPQDGIITSIGPQHLETFFTMDNIVHTKFELAEALPENGRIFLNGDCQYITGYCAKYPNRILYSAAQTDKEEPKNGYYAKEVDCTRMGTEFTVVTPEGEEERFSMRLIGEHNVINVIGAIAVAHTYGIALVDLKVPVRKLQPVKHRMELIERGNVTIIDDAYNSNPVGSKAAVETLAMFDGAKILITPGMVELGKTEDEWNEKFGTYAAKACDYVVLVGKKHTEPIAAGLKKSGFDEEKIHVVETLNEAVSYAYALPEERHKYILLENDLPDNY